MATDFRLWVRDSLDEIDGQIAALMRALALKAKAFAGAVMPGFTHLQSAQPVTFGHHLLAYVEMLARDRGRFADARKRLNESPLGAAALAGTSFPIDREMTARLLGFDRPTANSIDSVSDRDFAIEAMAAASICACTCRASLRNRDLDDAAIRFRQPDGCLHHRLVDHAAEKESDAAELVRAKSGRIIGALNALLVVMEGPAARLCQGYAGGQGTDLRRADDALALPRRHDRHGRGYDAASEAHEGQRPVRLCNRDRSRRLACPRDRPALPRGASRHWSDRGAASKTGRGLEALSLDEMQTVESRITAEVFEVLGVEKSVRSRTSHGGAAPANVARQASRWLRLLKTA